MKRDNYINVADEMPPNNTLIIAYDLIDGVVPAICEYGERQQWDQVQQKFIKLGSDPADARWTEYAPGEDNDELTQVVKWQHMPDEPLELDEEITDVFLPGDLLNHYEAGEHIALLVSLACGGNKIAGDALYEHGLTISYRNRDRKLIGLYFGDPFKLTNIEEQYDGQIN